FQHTDPRRTVISTLSLHDALPIWQLAHLRAVGADRGNETVEARIVVEQRLAARSRGDDEIELREFERRRRCAALEPALADLPGQDRKSTRLNSSHVKISYAVFCLK